MNPFLFLFHSLVRRPSAALPLVSVVPLLWIIVQTPHTPPTAQPKTKQNPSLSAQFTPQVLPTALYTLLQETRDVPFTQMEQAPQQSANSTQQGLTTALTVPFTPQGRLQTAPRIPQGRVSLAIMTVPFIVRGPSQNPQQTAHSTPQGSKSASVLQTRTPRKRRLKQGIIVQGIRQEETQAA